MKKLIIALSVLALSATTIPAHAESKSLVIIDSYFDSRVIGGNVSCVTLQNTACQDVVIKSAIPTSLSSSINHGNAMAEVAKKQSTGLPVILLRAANASAKSVSDVNAGNFIDALTWVNNNSSRVSAVSFSRYFNGNTTCSPASVNTASYGGVAKADQTIRSLILLLKNKGIPVFVSTGNKQGSKIDYPACITDTNSVSVGGANKLGATVSSYAWDNTTDYFASSTVYSYSSPVLGLIANTTSAGTAAVAAKYVSGSLDNKFVNVLN